MLKQKNRLSLALMLETHLDELLSGYMPPSGKKGQESPAHTCFVCREIDTAVQKLLENTARTAVKDPDFAALLAEQPYYCFAHYEALCDTFRAVLPKKAAALLIQKVTACERSYFQSLRDDVHAFTTTFDYRSTKAGSGKRAGQNSGRTCSACAELTVALMLFLSKVVAFYPEKKV